MQNLESSGEKRSRQSLDALNHARALVSVRLLCGEDLDDVLAGGQAARSRLARKLVIRLERERLKGLRGHWSYDLNRHIGLRQALDLVAQRAAGPEPLAHAS